MDEVAAPKKKPAARRRAHVSTADKELKAMKAVMKDITSSKEKALAFLKEAGLVDRKGRLAKPYRD